MLVVGCSYLKDGLEVERSAVPQGNFACRRTRHNSPSIGRPPRDINRTPCLVLARVDKFCAHGIHRVVLQRHRRQHLHKQQPRLASFWERYGNKMRRHRLHLRYPSTGRVHRDLEHSQNGRRVVDRPADHGLAHALTVIDDSLERLSARATGSKPVSITRRHPKPAAVFCKKQRKPSRLIPCRQKSSSAEDSALD